MDYISCAREGHIAYIASITRCLNHQREHARLHKKDIELAELMRAAAAQEWSRTDEIACSSRVEQNG